ncbi:DUF2931 family protein [Vibrio sp. CK2-1]|uniref:DUF2931 family protein n=1 Tax=Vibrio sp. CK2-1 TaxID=2912249 RepID=UPI001F2136CA|nr:DUF2931 family protein [Vibrio sp. CK2-1]MCF7353235.1 DUF2931 family protein [Vibrio sp. CK2-1]
MIQKWCKRTLLLLAIISLPCVAFSQVPEVPKDKMKWRIGVTAPSFYPIYVSKSYGVNEQEDWTSILFNHTAVLRRISLSNTQEWLSDYDGFGTALNSLTIDFPYQMGGTNHLPDSIYVYWTSMHDLKFYVTKFDVSDKIKALMLRKKYRRHNGKERSCYTNDFVLGLLPNGHAKVWLYGCLDYIYVGELEPFKIMQQDYQGVKATELSETTAFFKTIEKQANDLGYSLFPIPWDKVNKTYWRKDITHVYSINDYNDQGDLINPRGEPVKPEPQKPSYRCWDDKPPVPDRPIKLDKSSPQYAMQRLLWNYSPDLIGQIPASDSTLNDAWNEATRKGLEQDHTQTWVLARLVALSDYPLDKLYKELKVTEKGQKSIKQYVDEMCL